MRCALCPRRSDVVPLRVALCALLVYIFLPDVTEAQGLFQGISGSLEYNYSFFDTQTSDVFGNKTETKSHDHNPRFTLNIDTKIYPNLRFHAGGLAEADISDVKTGGIGIDTTVTRFRPYVDLTLQTPLYTAGMGYVRREDRTKIEGFPSVTLVSDEYNGLLEWKPDAFPYSKLYFQRISRSDDRKQFLDTKEDILNLISKYTYKGLYLNYWGLFTDTQNNIVDLDTKEQVHNGNVAYTDAFFNKRVSLQTNFNVIYQQTKIVSKGRGTVQFPIFPFAGLFSIDPTPGDSTDIPMLPNPALIDGDLVTSTGIDLGLPAVGDPTDPRNIGLDLLNVTEINQLLVWIDRDLSSNPIIANSFSWQIWTSSDNSTWTLLTTISPAPFGPFQNRFELNFSNVNTRYIKVVVSPLSPAIPGAAGFPDIFITELQAFVSRPAEDVEGKVSSTEYIYNLDARTRIFDVPLLFYELTYFFNRVEPSLASSEQRYDLSNALSVNHRLSRVLVGTARVGVENGEERNGRRLAYVYNASLIADPLRTLHDSLVLSGRTETIGGRPNDTYSAFLYNTAQLYNGIDANLNGGVTFRREETEQWTRDFIINLGANIVPHRTVIFVLNYSDKISKQWGGETEGGSTYTSTLDMSINYNPFRTLNLFASWDIVAEKGRKTETTQNYAINWSPFPDGALQFNFTYNENLRSEINEKERIVTPSVRWNITRRSYLDVSYQIIRTRSDLEKTDSKFLSTNLKIFF
jgi:hypothetical protein